MKSVLCTLVALVFLGCQTTSPEGSVVRDFESPPVRLMTQPFAAVATDEIQVCSFNIKFLGFYLNKKNQELIDLVAACDIMVVQELVATPRNVWYRDGRIRRLDADPEASQFSDLMARKGFSMWVSNEDTGKTANRSNDSVSEWHIAFYRPEKVALNVRDSGFLDDVLVANPIFDRVPYAFAFKALGLNKTDFVLISAHLASEKTDHDRRRKEFTAVKNWISLRMRRDRERDYLLVGDLNIQTESEFRNFITAPPESMRMVSLNDACQGSNIRKENPYDHVIYSPDHSSEVVPELLMIDLGETFSFLANFSDVRTFSPFYSDHFPMAFRIRILQDDD